MLACNGVNRFVALGLLAVSLALAGCGSPTGRVTGKVTLKNQPVPGAELRFESAANASDYYRGLTEEDGTIQVDYKKMGGLPVGDYKIIIKHYTLRDKLLPPGEAGEVLKDENQTKAHTTIFEKTITSGSNELNLEITDGKKAAK